MNSVLQERMAVIDEPRLKLSLGRVVRLYFNETRCEFLKRMRLPGFVIPTVLFPLMFYAIFGLPHSQEKLAGTTVGAYLLATYGTFGVISVSLFGFGVGVAVERGMGWMQVKRASPMPAFADFTAKILMSLLFTLIMMLLLFGAGAVFGHVRMPAETWFGLSAVLLLGVVPFSALGLAVGYFAGANSAPAICNLIYLPMSFASGLWMPLQFLPKPVQKIALVLPGYHLAQLGLDRIRGGFTGSDWKHVGALIASAVVFLALAAVGFRRDEGKTYG